MSYKDELGEFYLFYLSLVINFSFKECGSAGAGRKILNYSYPFESSYQNRVLSFLVTDSSESHCVFGRTDF